MFHTFMAIGMFISVIFGICFVYSLTPQKNLLDYIALLISASILMAGGFVVYKIMTSLYNAFDRFFKTNE